MFGFSSATRSSSMSVRRLVVDAPVVTIRNPLTVAFVSSELRCCASAGLRACFVAFNTYGRFESLKLRRWQGLQFDYFRNRDSPTTLDYPNGPRKLFSGKRLVVGVGVHPICREVAYLQHQSCIWINTILNKRPLLVVYLCADELGPVVFS